jgi:hypothetical protein
LLQFIGLDYGQVFSPAEQQLHQLRDDHYMMEFYNQNKNQKVPV